MKIFCLRDWIEEQGTANVARLLQIQIRTVNYWKAGKHMPTQRMARRIMEVSNLTLEGIYGSR